MSSTPATTALKERSLRYPRSAPMPTTSMYGYTKSSSTSTFRVQRPRPKRSARYFLMERPYLLKGSDVRKTVTSS
jgi:hypothetical protein